MAEWKRVNTENSDPCHAELRVTGSLGNEIMHQGTAEIPRPWIMSGWKLEIQIDILQLKSA